jgi:hypothetical protein
MGDYTPLRETLPPSPEYESVVHAPVRDIGFNDEAAKMLKPGLHIL